MILKPFSSLTVILNQNTQKHLESLPFHIPISCPSSGNIVYSSHSCRASLWHWPQGLLCLECSFQQPFGRTEDSSLRNSSGGSPPDDFPPRQLSPLTWRCRQVHAAASPCPWNPARVSASAGESESYCTSGPLPPVTPGNHWGQRTYAAVSPELIFLLSRQ